MYIACLELAMVFIHMDYYASCDIHINKLLADTWPFSKLLC